MPKILIEFTRDEISELGTMVICEMWEKRSYGRIRRAFLEEFSEEERITLSRLYPKIYDWNLRRGIPQGVKMKMATYDLIQRACNFFGTI